MEGVFFAAVWVCGFHERYGEPPEEIAEFSEKTLKGFENICALCAFSVKKFGMEAAMETVTVSQNYQVIIPQVVRESMRIKPGKKVQVLQYENRIELIPLRSMKEMRGFLKGIDTTVEREEDRR